MPDTRAAEDRVGAYWDALVLGHETAGIDLDPALADAIEQFHAMGTAPPSTARERVWQRLEPLVAGETPVTGRLALSRPALKPIGPATTANGHVAAPDARRREAPLMRPVGRRARSHLATAALLVLTLAVGYAAIRLQAPEVRDEATRLPALIRALASAPGDAVADQLVEATFGSEDLPAGAREAIFYRLTLPPGASLPYLAGPLCGRRGEIATAGVGVEVVQSGAYAVRLDAPVRVRDGDAADGEDEFPAGTEVVLGPGETVVYPDYGAAGTVRNAGDEPMVLVGVAIVAADGPGTAMTELPAGVIGESLGRAIPSELRSLPAGPVRVGLWRLTLPAGGRAGPYEAPGLEALRVERGAITRHFLRPGDTAPRFRPLFHTTGTSAPFAAPVPGARRVIASVGDEPAELLAVLIEPAGVRLGALAP